MVIFPLPIEYLTVWRAGKNEIYMYRRRRRVRDPISISSARTSPARIYWLFFLPTTQGRAQTGIPDGEAIPLLLLLPPLYHLISYSFLFFFETTFAKRSRKCLSKIFLFLVKEKLFFSKHLLARISGEKQ